MGRIPLDLQMLRSFTGWFLIVCSITLILACSPKKVYLPQEWSAQPPTRSLPVPQYPSAQLPPQMPEPTPSYPGQGPVLMEPPAIKERDVVVGPETPPPVRKAEPPPPQELASMHVVDQGKSALAQGKPDAAIPLFEKAISVDVYNGDAFFGLARAWRMKGSRNKALEFARKAEVIFQENRTRLKEVYLFEADVYKDIGDMKKMDFYRQKAAEL